RLRGLGADAAPPHIAGTGADRVQRGTASLSRGRRFLPARAVAGRDLFHPQVPLQHVGEGDPVMASVQFERVTKTFGKVIATNDVSLTVADGEFIVLLGPSGCGKTTLLRGLAGLEKIDAGRILIGERDVT